MSILFPRVAANSSAFYRPANILAVTAITGRTSRLLFASGQHFEGFSIADNDSITTNVQDLASFEFAQKSGNRLSRRADHLSDFFMRQTDVHSYNFASSIVATPPDQKACQLFSR